MGIVLQVLSNFNYLSIQCFLYLIFLRIFFTFLNFVWLNCLVFVWICAWLLRILVQILIQNFFQFIIFSWNTVLMIWSWHSILTLSILLRLITQQFKVIEASLLNYYGCIWSSRFSIFLIIIQCLFLNAFCEIVIGRTFLLFFDTQNSYSISSFLRLAS